MALTPRATVKTFVTASATTPQLQAVASAAVDFLIELQSGSYPSQGPMIRALAAAVITNLNGGAAIVGDGNNS